jgi:hypothetical protein
VRFDPHYIPGEDAPLTASGEIDLPDDLVELAAQLGDDAAFLAQKYPADITARRASEGEFVDAERSSGIDRILPHNAARRSRFGLKALASIGTLAAALAITVAVSPMFLHQAPVSDEPVAANPAVVSTPVSESDIIIDPPATPGGPRIGRLRNWVPTPALGEVTGPELEGLLDLWQNDEHPAETRISI